MDWLAKHYAVIICDEWNVHIPYGDEVLIIEGDGCKGGREKLFAKFSKCEFWLSTVKFLGYMIDSEGIHVDPTKIESIKVWASPKTPTEIYQFLGLAGYY
ncbi:hypothetical protein Tco_1157714 [Tanacetum coccineum]